MKYLFIFVLNMHLFMVASSAFGAALDPSRPVSFDLQLDLNLMDNSPGESLEIIPDKKDLYLLSYDKNNKKIEDVELGFRVYAKKTSPIPFTLSVTQAQNICANEQGEYPLPGDKFEGINKFKLDNIPKETISAKDIIWVDNLTANRAGDANNHHVLSVIFEQLPGDILNTTTPRFCRGFAAILVLPK